jgi:hypothetical protein
MKPILNVVDQGQRIQLVLPHALRATTLDTVHGARMSALICSTRNARSFADAR